MAKGPRKPMYSKEGRLLISRLSMYEKRLIRDYLQDRIADAKQALNIACQSVDLFPTYECYATQREFWVKAIASLEWALGILGWTPPKLATPTAVRPSRVKHDQQGATRPRGTTS